MRIVLTINLLLLLVTAVARGETDSARERWNQLPEAEKQRLRQNYDRWKSLAPEEKTRLKHNYETFRSLPREQRDVVLKRYNKFKELPE